MNNTEKLSDLIFYKINGHLIDISSCELTNYIILPSVLFETFINKNTYSSDYLKEQLGIKLLKGNYEFHDEVTLVSFRKKSFLRGLINYLDPCAENFEIELKIEKFRHAQKENLLNELMAPTSNMFSILKSLSDYTFSCHFSLWNYDEELEVFTCFASSFTEAGKVIASNMTNTLLDNVESTGEGIESSGLNKESPLYGSLNDLGMKSLNRIVIKYGESKSKVAIATFYSSHENFIFCKKLGGRISKSVNNKLTELLEGSNDKYEKFAKSVRTDLNSVDIKTYSDNFLDGLCEHFDYYSAGIFIFEDDELHQMSVCGELTDKNGLISTVIDGLQQKDKFIFYNKSQNLNVSNEELNYQDPIKSVLVRSFIIQDLRFVFIMAKELANDKVTVKLPYFYNEDSMERVTDFLLFNLKVLIAQTATLRELEQAKNFMKVWRHEIRSPISKFNLGSDFITKLIEKVEFDDKIKHKVLVQLRDIKLMGNRLKQLTDVYSFDVILDEKQRKKVKLSVLADVVIPIINSIKDYAEKQHSIELFIDRNGLHGQSIVSDIKLLNMVLNALVDNALKYSSKNSDLVKITGKKTSTGFTISVSNKGVPIDLEDKKIIFNDGIRGKNAKKQHIDGTGVGLYIAQSVMHSLGGSVELTSNKEDHIEFSILIPKSEVTDV